MNTKYVNQLQALHSKKKLIFNKSILNQIALVLMRITGLVFEKIYEFPIFFFCVLDFVWLIKSMFEIKSIDHEK